ncbi:hypothetical protein R54876_GBNLAHCA_01018 [Eupransor demetentiae]|uniref:Uncharacterized protein n=1 Tax=Eupransor demetentiae TaxID=3109584 RepID=A0ABM9N5I0_9LACO|nr:hypothetical protein R54876_GBNLAHCA_01018 [Lactobacillaceae bacterium LMG 33000]
MDEIYEQLAAELKQSIHDDIQANTLTMFSKLLIK